MVVINSILTAWYIAIGGIETLSAIFSTAFLFTVLFVFYKIAA